MTVSADTQASVVLFATSQGNFLASCAAAVERSARYAAARGADVSLTAILVSATPLTRRVAEHALDGRWRVIDLLGADLGQARNAARAVPLGRFVAFVDADDLWCETWLDAACDAASRRAALWHPEWLLTFGTDFHAHWGAGYAAVPQPDEMADSSILLTHDAVLSGFVAPRELILSQAWPDAAPEAGWTAVDRWWKCEVIAAGGETSAVPGSFHYRRNAGAFGAASAARPDMAAGLVGPTKLARARPPHRAWQDRVAAAGDA